MVFLSWKLQERTLADEIEYTVLSTRSIRVGTEIVSNRRTQKYILSTKHLEPKESKRSEPSQSKHYLGIMPPSWGCSEAALLGWGGESWRIENLLKELRENDQAIGLPRRASGM